MLNGVNSGFAGPTLTADNRFTRRDFTQEVRLQSDFPDKPVNFLLGGYYQDARVRTASSSPATWRSAFPTLTAGINDVRSRLSALRPAALAAETLEIARRALYRREA